MQASPKRRYDSSGYIDGFLLCFSVVNPNTLEKAVNYFLAELTPYLFKVCISLNAFLMLQDKSLLFLVGLQADLLVKDPAVSSSKSTVQGSKPQSLGFGHFSSVAKKIGAYGYFQCTYPTTQKLSLTVPVLMTTIPLK